MRETFWKGTLGFGLVSIPVTLQSAEQRRELDFSMVDRRDLSPVGYRKVNKKTGAEVPREQIVKAYKADDRYIVMTEEELKAASPERSQSIEIKAFVEAGDIAPSFFERPYFVLPQPKSEKAYALLREAMRRTRKAGIATFVISTREHLAAVLARGPVLMLELLRFGHELRAPEELALSDAMRRPDVTEAELKMAERLIGDMTQPWRPAEFKDTFHDELLRLIKRKAETGQALAAPAAAETAKAGPPVDIMTLLKRSLAQVGSASAQERRHHRRGRVLH